MRNGQPHQLVPTPEDGSQELAVRYRWSKRGERYRVRVSAPSCRILFLEQMEQLQAPYTDLRPAARTALLDVLIRRRFKWPRPVREAMLEQFERWQVWKAQPARVEHA